MIPLRINIMRVKTEELIEITDQIDNILHNRGYIVDHNVLADHIFRTIRESYPNDDIELDGPNVEKLAINLGQLLKKN